MKLFARACIAVSIALIPVACGSDDEKKSSATCGNNTVEGDEQCDGTDLNGETCDTATMMARPNGSLSCNDDCTLNMDACTESGSAGGTGGATGGTGGSTGGTGGSTGGTGGSTGGMGGMMTPPMGGTMGMPDGGDAGGAGGGDTDGGDMDGGDMDSGSDMTDAAADADGG